MSTNKKYVGEEAARALAAGIGAATPRTWDLTPDDLDSVTSEEQDRMVLMQFPTPASLKAALADIKAGDMLDASKLFEVSPCLLTVTGVRRYEESDGAYCTVYASMTDAGEGVAYYFHVRNDTVEVVVFPLVEPEPPKLSASAGGSSWQYGAIPNWGDLGERPSDWSYYGTGSASQPRDFKIGDTFRTPTLVPYGRPPSEASDDPADQAGANYAEGTIIGAGKVQNVPYLVVVGAARFGKKTSATAKDDETITAPGIFYITASNAANSPAYWYVKFYPLLNKWKELENIAGEVLVISAGLGIVDEKIKATRDKLGGMTNAVRPRVIVGRLPRIGSKGTHNYYLTPKLQYSDGTCIPVNLNTRAFREWCGDAEVTEPFIIEAVRLQRVYLSIAPGDPCADIKPELSPVNITVENGVATITKKTLGAIDPSPYGLFADMAVYRDLTTTDNRRIVRYDEARGLVACHFPGRAGSFAVDRLTPPTYAEVVGGLYNHNTRRSDNYIQIQFRSRAVKPKGVTASEATKRYHFWSYKKKWGTVFRVRRTHGQRYLRTTDNPDTGRRVKTRSYAHRNFGASEWHYYSVKWRTVVGSDGKKKRYIAALRRLG